MGEFTANVMTRPDTTVTPQFHTSWVGAMLSGNPLFWFWTMMANPALWLGLLLTGVAGAVGQI